VPLMTSLALVPDIVTPVGQVICAWPRAAKPRTTSATSTALVMATIADSLPDLCDVPKPGGASIGKCPHITRKSEPSSTAMRTRPRPGAEGTIALRPFAYGRPIGVDSAGLGFCQGGAQE